MIRHARSLFLSTMLLVAALVPITPSVRATASEPLVMIINTSVSLKDITLPMLRRAFEGSPVEYASGKRIIPFNALSESSDRVLFDRAVLGLTPDEMARFWVDQRIRSAAQAPRTIGTPELAVRVIASLPGAITYVRESKADRTVRVLSIEGKSPEDEDYLLR